MRCSKWQMLAYGAEFMVCAWMAMGAKPQARADHGSDIAVLQSRADQIDHHLQYTDDQVGQLWELARAQGNQLSEMQGEERAAFGILTLLTAGNFVVQIGRRKRDP